MLAEQPTLYRACTIDGCEKPAKARGWCPTHYKRWRKHGDPNTLTTFPDICTIDGCGAPHKARGWCGKHYQRWLAYGDPNITVRETNPPNVCTFDGCDQPHLAKGWCRTHYRHLADHNVCAINGCDKPINARGWCPTHYARWLKHGDPNAVTTFPDICTIDGCGKPFKSKGWCSTHYQRWRAHGDPNVILADRNPPEVCTIDGCGNTHYSRGWCERHYDRHRRHGDPNAVATSSPPRDVPTVVYLVAHPHLNALKIGIHWPEATYDRIAKHEGYGWQPVEQWTLSDRDGAEALERAVLDWWRGQGWPDAVFPEDMPQGGWTETVSAHHVAASDVVAFVDRRLTEKISDPNGSAYTASLITKEVP